MKDTLGYMESSICPGPRASSQPHAWANSTFVGRRSARFDTHVLTVRSHTRLASLEPLTQGGRAWALSTPVATPARAGLNRNLKIKPSCPLQLTGVGYSVVNSLERWELNNLN